jgi:glycosyltransferase involved in cell wall biosynthesis
VEHFITTLPIEQQIVFAVLILGLLIQTYYYLFIYLRPVLWKRKETNNTTEPLSVIICARNEYENLKNNLSKILDQQYPDFEVIVVNDCSADDTEMLLGKMELKYKNLRHTTIEADRKFLHGKKLAITIGMKSAKNNRLVFIDADCYPASTEWLSEINKTYVPNKQIVLGYGGYEKSSGFLNRIIRYDTLFIAMQYIGFAMAGRPYMGIGRNLSYLKQLFFAGTGFSKHYHILSGDDDLFINENANKENTAVVLSKDSFTRSTPQTHWNSWAKQKKRHLSSGKYYKTGDKFFLVLEPFSRLLFYTSIIVLLYFKADLILIGSVFLFRLVMQTTIMKLNMNKMSEKGLLLLIPIFDLFLPVIHLVFIISNNLNRRKNKWK